MTIYQLYKWAEENDALDLDIETREFDGSYSEYAVDPEIIDKGGYMVVQL